MSSTGLKQAIRKLSRAGTKATKAGTTGLAGATAAQSIAVLTNYALGSTELAAKIPTWPTTLTTGKTLMVPIAEGDNVCFVVQLTSTDDDAVSGRYTVKAGDQWQSDLGDATFDISSSSSARVKTGVFGPFESARFGYRSTSTPLLGSKGDMVVRVEYTHFKTTKSATCLAGAGAARKGHIAAFALPKVEYDA